MADVYDIGLLGAGPGGLAVVEEARALGLSVICLDARKQAGGTCLHEGCIPSKALLHGSYLYERTVAGWGGDWGIGVSKASIDVKALMARKQATVERLARGADSLMQGKGSTYVCARGQIDKDGDNGFWLVTDKKERFRVKNVIVATGSVSTSLPFLPLDGEGVVESRGGLGWTSVPRHLAVVGGGYIGLELGSVWRRLGAQVSIIEQMDDILMTMDGDIRVALRRALQQQGLDMLLQTTVQGYDKVKGGYRLKLKEKDTTRTLDVSHILVAVGRKPCCEGLGLDELGVVRDERGFIVVDETMRTSVAGIWAIGDVVGGLMLAHKADSEARIAVRAMSGGTTERLLPQHIPCVVYTHPEVACVGVGEDALKADKKAYGKGVAHFRANGRAVAMGADEGFVKVLRDERDSVVGVHMMGAEVGTVLAEAVAALRFSASCQDIAMQCQAHPTLNEALTRAAAAARL
ncbi:MAG: dihydrolipoyl dehydrogenase [Alphaproteobacteria bacterium GM202ARS2]|nr:dihydrolipoyl dehydrogenase [Alphaproteobacteria bacterium GM202ARS2]